MLKFAYICICIFLLSIHKASANPYLPLIEKSQSIYNYSFEVKTGRKEFKQADTKGSIKVTAKEFEEKSGKKYLRYISIYKDIPFMKEEIETWRREENGKIFSGIEDKGVFSETLELPDNPQIGSEWDYNDGVASRRKIIAKTTFTSPSGIKIDNCLVIKRIILKNEALKNFKDTTTYCLGYGNVQTLLINPSPVGDYVTETALTEFIK